MALYHGGEIKEGKLECVRNGQPYTLQDDAPVLAFFAENSGKPAMEMAQLFLSNVGFFGQDLTAIPGLLDYVGKALEEILTRGMREVMNERFGG